MVLTFRIKKSTCLKTSRIKIERNNNYLLKKKVVVRSNGHNLPLQTIFNNFLSIINSGEAPCLNAKILVVSAVKSPWNLIFNHITNIKRNKVIQVIL